MKTNQIDGVLRRARVTDYIGTFSCDRLPSKTGVMVSNTDPHHLPGTHWVAIYVSKDRLYGEFFDPLGRPPNEHFRRYMNRCCKYWFHNSKQLQSVVSETCGHYCIAYCIARGKGVNMNRFVSYFTRDTGFNDAVLRRVFRRFVQ